MSEIMAGLPEQVMEHVTLRTGYPEGAIAYDQELNFLTNGERIIGFGMMSRSFTTVHPPETIEDLPVGKRKFIDNAKGIGFRVGNQPSAMVQPIRRAPSPIYSPLEHAPVYALEISGLQRSKIMDARRQGQLAHVGGYFRHLSLLAESKLFGDQRAIDRASRVYGDSNAARLSVPPSWLDEQRIRGIHHVTDPEMLILRSHKITIRKIGEVSLDAFGLTSTS
jgi:hypothetical protein